VEVFIGSLFGLVSYIITTTTQFTGILDVFLIGMKEMASVISNGIGENSFGPVIFQLVQNGFRNIFRNIIIKSSCSV
jgi:hypothetical protein